MACKQALAALSVLSLAACGAAAKPEGKRIRGAGYSFVAPAGWKIGRAPRKTTARSGAQLVSVEVFPLVHAYEPVLFPKVKRELDRLAADLAVQAGGRVTERRTTTVARRRVRTYEIALSRRGERVVERIAFVLEGKREYQLLCRFSRGADESPCEQLLGTFALA